MTKLADKVEAMLDEGQVPDIPTIRALIAQVRGQAPTPKPSKPRKRGMSVAERAALCEALNARRVGAYWRPCRPRMRGGTHAVTTGGTLAVRRDDHGYAEYITTRSDTHRICPLGMFVGKGWVERLADAVKAKFLELNPINGGWAPGQTARTKDGSEFVVGEIVDHLCNIEWLRWYEPPDLVFLELCDEATSLRHPASECTRVE